MSVTKIYSSLISSELFYFIRNIYLTAIDLVSFLFADSATQLQCSDASEDLSTGTCFCSNFQRCFFQLINYTVNLGKHFIFFLLHLLHSFFQLLPVAWT